MGNPYGLQVGQVLWYVPERQKLPDKGYELTITKIGTKWAMANRSRISLDSLYLDGGDYASPGRCFLSKEHAEKEMAADKTWIEFIRKVNCIYNRPPGLSQERILELATQLNVSLS